MGKVLITELNGIIENESLFRLNEFRYKLTGKANCESRMYFYNTYETKVYSDIPVMIDNVEKTEAKIEPNKSFSVSLINDNDVATIKVINKSKVIDRWECYRTGIALDFNDFKSSSVDFKINKLMAERNFNNLDIDSPFLSNADEITVFGCKGGHGDLSSLNVDNFINLRLSDSGSFTGNIEVFGKSVNMTRLGVQGLLNVTGSVDKLAKAMVANGRTSGEISLEMEASGCTWESISSTPKKIVFDSSYSNGYQLS